jgi:GNAT superfamily N-acetyltransferase
MVSYDDRPGNPGALGARCKPMPLQLEIREPRGEEELASYFRLRYEQLREPQGLPPGSERRGEIEEGSTHLVAVSEGRIVGATAMIVGMKHDAESGKRYIFVHWRNMAIDPQLQRAGVGSAMYAEVEQRARDIGAREIIGNARDDKLPFFESLGFHPTGPGESLMGISHTAIVKLL